MNRPSAGQGMAGFSEDGEIPLKAGSVIDFYVPVDA